jgi:transcriptional regulator
MPSDPNAEILAKLDLLVRLQALNMVKDFESSKAKILFLSAAGMQPIEIAGLLETSSNNVNVTLSKARKPKKRDDTAK